MEPVRQGPPGCRGASGDPGGPIRLQIPVRAGRDPVQRVTLPRRSAACRDLLNPAVTERPTVDPGTRPTVYVRRVAPLGPLGRQRNPHHYHRLKPRFLYVSDGCFRV